MCSLRTSSPVLSGQNVGEPLSKLQFCHFNFKFGHLFPLEILESVRTVRLGLDAYIVLFSSNNYT